MREIITLAEYYMGRDAEYKSELTPEIEANARETVLRVNKLLNHSGIVRRVASGWRPAAVNKATPGAAARSKHMLALACDLADADGQLDAWCMANLDDLKHIGLWLEHPNATKTKERFGEGWCHVQTVPPKSGARVYMP